MDSALAWIGQIAEWFGRFVPRVVILRTTHGAVKFVGGAKAIALGPGWHWYWPIRTDLEEYPTARQAVDLPIQTIVTADERTIIAGGIIVYEVKDILKAIAQTYSTDMTVREITLTAIHDVICRKTWGEIRGAQHDGTLDRELRKEAAAELDKYGIRVLKTTLTDLAPCRVLKLVQTMSHDGGA